MAKFGSRKSLETSLKSWPYPDMPGVPLNYKQDGLHYIGDAVASWCARRAKWGLICRTREEKPEWLIKQDWAEYRGPCPNIDEWEKSVSEIEGMRVSVNDARNGAVAASECAGRMMEDRDEAFVEIARLRSGLMKSVQYDNKCDQTGRSCREDGPCACQKEAETWLENG